MKKILLITITFVWIFCMMIMLFGDFTCSVSMSSSQIQQEVVEDESDFGLEAMEL